jgi:hypothetical protein
VVTKTYPTPARRGVEVSCTMAFSEERGWVRLFPIPFRFLRDEQKFRKYQWISASVSKAPRDPRPESYHVDDWDSIEVTGGPIPTRDKWAGRKEILLPLLAPSLESLREERKTRGMSLGLIKPREIRRLSIAPSAPDWEARDLERLRQASFFDRQPHRVLEKIPYDFRYEFRCGGDGCRGHSLKVTDWEICQAFRAWQRKYGAAWEGKFRHRFEHEMIGKNDTHFFVGTLRYHPAVWIIVGLFYPPR